MNSKKLSFFEVILKSILGIVFVVGLNPLLAGRWDYWQGWVFSAVMVMIIAISLVLFRDKLDLAQERMHPGRGVKWWDKIIFAGFSLFTLLAWVVGVLDTGRFGWSSEFPVWGYLLSYLVFFFSVFMFTWSMMANKWFSSVMRIQKDRGQQVCQEGPYRYMRHPGYVGGILLALSMGLVFGSYRSLIPGLIATVFLIVRTYLEDRTLQMELPGYLEYTKKVRYRLIPGVW